MINETRSQFLRRGREALLLAALGLGYVRCGQPVTDPITADAEVAAGAVSEELLREHVTKLAADDLQGRGPNTDGDRATRAYLVEQLQALGLKPGAGDRWEQPFELASIRGQFPEQWTFQRGSEALALEWNQEFVAASGIQAERVSVSDAELVFVGYGIQAPEYGWDDFKAQNLSGKILMMLNDDPNWDPELFAGDTRLYYGRWTYKYESAARQGAVGAIIIHTTASAGYPFAVLQTTWGAELFELPHSGDARFQLKSWITEDAARSLVSFAGMNLADLVQAARSRNFEPIPMGITTSLSFANEITRANSANVYSTLEGSDPTIRDEYVIYTAHHDGLGVGDPDANGDTIYNGALDNASGVAEVLAVAKAFTALRYPPRRSVMFLFVGAEEQGLLGSSYFVQNSPIPHGKIAANINYDIGNRWGRTRDITYVGKGRSSLDAVAEMSAARQGRVVRPDQFPDLGMIYRSDQLSFMKVGVPALYLETGTEFVDRPLDWGMQQVEYYRANEYHQPSDELTPDWNFEGMLDDARVGFWAGYMVANDDELPSWVPGDEFESERSAALEGVVDVLNTSAKPIR